MGMYGWIAIGGHSRTRKDLRFMNLFSSCDPIIEHANILSASHFNCNMSVTERFKPYRRGTSKQSIIDYLRQSDQVPTCRDHLTLRALQMEAANRQRRLDAGILTSHLDISIHSSQIPQPVVPSDSSSETANHHVYQGNGISPALLEAVEYHGQPQDTESSSGSEGLSSDPASSPDPFAQNHLPVPADQIEFSGDEELIDLASHGGSDTAKIVVDSEQQNQYLNLFEGVDVFAPVSVASDPPTPTLAPNDEVDNVNANVNDSNIGEQVVQSTNAFEPQSQVVERLDKLINLQSQALCINLLTFGTIFQARAQGSDAPTIPVTKE